MVCILLEQVDVILGINWLELNQVFTNCFDKLVQYAADGKCSDDGKVVLFLTLKMLPVQDSYIYDLPLEREFEFDGGEELTFVSAKQVRESVKDMTQVFVMLTSLGARGQGVVCDFPRVCEFPGVFSGDISDLPPEREMGFSIDLVPGTRLVPMIPYRMSASEMGKLKKQLEYLLEKKLEIEPFVWKVFPNASFV
ncbi:uncharacterized protein LOC127122380 [Lathyrus oleraceus]|uniref:uncharacterized protein LOC127122380 n=1 Tax=Pisum sativum TaxID=3888 RepID=UPI0021CF451C|nr:uncharacterized protein LOC127122380 [Pisum sativum]